MSLSLSHSFVLLSPCYPFFPLALMTPTPHAYDDAAIYVIYAVVHTTRLWPSGLATWRTDPVWQANTCWTLGPCL